MGATGEAQKRQNLNKQKTESEGFMDFNRPLNLNPLHNFFLVRFPDPEITTFFGGENLGYTHWVGEPHPQYHYEDLSFNHLLGA